MHKWHRRLRVWGQRAVFAGSLWLGSAASGQTESPDAGADPPAASGPVSMHYVRLANGRFVLQDQPADPTQPLQPLQPIQPIQPVQPDVNQPLPGAGTGGYEPTFSGRDFDLLAEASAMSGSAVAPEGVTAGNMRNSATADLVDAVQESDSVQALSSQRRSSASFDPRIRGYRFGQIYTDADGGFWIPGREDLDTPLSMIDPSMVQSVAVLAGPYSVQYGPGFAFISVLTQDTPRYCCGPEAHLSLGATYYGNGDQLRAHERGYGGGDAWGFSFFHATRFGNAYESGDGTVIPADYNNQDFLGQLGFDISPWQRVEFRYLRQDQTNTQYPGQFFKIDAGVTEGFNVQVTDESPDGPWDKLVVGGYYNITRYNGSTDPGEATFGVTDRVRTALANRFSDPAVTFDGTTEGLTFITGGRLAATYGKADETRLTVGTDFRFVQQSIQENFTINATNPSNNLSIFTNLPTSDSVNPGLFAELEIPWTSYWTTTVGARGDYLHTEVTGDLRQGSGLQGPLTEDNGLYAFFLSNKVDLDDVWATRFGFGRAQRPPTLTERYADGLFLGLLQNGFSRALTGIPNLPVERLWQVDLGLEGKGDYARGRVGAFYSWINDYSTYGVLDVNTPMGAQFVFIRTTELATLTGFEAYGEYDWTRRVTLFGGAFYVEGEDQQIKEALPQIYPLEGSLGVRLHDPCQGKFWGIELAVRIVDQQDRLAFLRDGLTDQVRTTASETHTGGFAVCNLRGYWNYSKRLSMMAGINNLFDRNYLEHLSLRLPLDQAGPFPEIGMFAPGFTPYVGAEYTY